MDLKNVKVIGFDADDTLWSNEPYFREGEEKFCDLMETYMPRHSAHRELFATEIANLSIYGYGIKAFVISMIETAIKIAGNTLPVDVISRIVEIGRTQLNQPVILLEGVEEVLLALKDKFRLVVVTKGDLLDQESKLEKSGLSPYFHHIEIVSEKRISDYQKLIRHLDIQPNEFLMIGNSLKSDVLPVLELGGLGVHVPFHTTWEHEKVDVIITNPGFRQVEHVNEILMWI
ncbi:MAG: HAD family hydrolase [Saprospiraceae bacterium]|jgi:putative hydrolase of the HAD superfamily|nr:HAD family hydrolase [Saprospiraceae bacterium]MBK9565591.1 HAD family hydrolase [Saprospiraceae bacterium]